MLSTRGLRLRTARSKKYASARSAALALGLPIATYGAHERAQSVGGRDYGPDEARRYAKWFGVTPEWLLTGYETTPSMSGNTVPIIGYVGANAEAHLYAVAAKDLEKVELSALATTVATVALEIRVNSLGAQYKNWLLVYDDLRQRISSDLAGKMCVIRLQDDRLLIKRLQQGGVVGQLTGTKHGPAIGQQTIEWAAAVKGIMQR